MSKPQVTELELPVEHLKLMKALAEEFGIKEDGPAGWGYLLAYQLVLKLDPRFASPKRARGRPGFKNDRYKLLLAAGRAVAEEHGWKIADLARDMAESKHGSTRRAAKAVRATARQIQNDAAGLSWEHKLFAGLALRSVRKGLSYEEFVAGLNDPGTMREAREIMDAWQSGRGQGRRPRAS
jgi:hypothetical protein